MKRAAIVVGAVAAVACAFACGVITVPPEPSAPENDCPPNDNTFCSARYPDASIAPLCFGGACVEGTSFRPIVVVKVPDGAISTLPGFAGATFALPESYQSLRIGNIPGACNGLPFECDFLPPLTEISKSLNLRVSKDFGIKLWPPGLRPNQPDPPLSLPSPTSLPIHGVFRPMWIDPATGTAMLARRLGLPLDDRIASTNPQTPRT